MSNAVKQRPQDGPGANGLRGGRNMYSSKTAVGSWLEEYGGACRYNRGFTTSDFQTEGQQAQMGATLRNPPEFGAGIAPPNANIVSTSDVFQPNPVTSDHWKTNTQLMATNAWKGKAVPQYTPESSVNRADLEAYRKQWTSDTATSRSIRFQTEARRAGNAAPDKFRVATVRMIPGTPKSLESYRTRLLERHGILAFAIFRKQLGSGVIECSQFQSAILSVGVPIPAAEYHQILAYFTPSSKVDVDQVAATIIAKTEGFDDQLASQYFAGLCAATDTSSQSVEDLQSLLSYDAYPEVAEGLCNYLPAYGRSQCGVLRVDLTAFLLLHSDLYAASPLNFYSVLPALWK